ncbi:50S ribosomal protein L18 [bacterium]|nr:50S ribosomal protein L18 [bacterium]
MRRPPSFNYANRPFSTRPDKRFNKPLQRPRPKRRVVRKKVYGTAECPRLVVFRSHKHIYGQLVDDSNKKTLATVSTHSKDLREKLKSLVNKTDRARIVGLALAAKAKSMHIQRVVFDRKSYFYYGRVKWLAEGAREGGLIFMNSDRRDAFALRRNEQSVLEQITA